jgi:hypothetical protein
VFSQALTEIIQRLDQARIQKLVQSYVLVGGFAVSVWGTPRATHDIDLAVALGAADPARLATHLKASYHPGGPDDPLRGVLSVELSTGGQMVPVQLIVFQPRWEEIVFKRVETVSVLKCQVPVVHWQALVLLKLYAGGPVDLRDARDIIAVRQPNSAERKDLADQARALGLANECKTLLGSLS